MPLSLVLAAQSLLQTSIVLCLVGYTTYQGSKFMVRGLGEQIGQDIGQEVNLSLNQTLDVPHRLNRFNAQVIEAGLIDIQNKTNLEQYFGRQIQEFPVNRVSWSNPQGGLVSAGRDQRGLTVAGTEGLRAGPLRVYGVDEQGKHQQQWVERAAYDSRDRPFYTAAVAAGRPIWTPIYVYIPSSQGLGLSASYPLYGPDRQLRGVLSSDIPLADLSRFLSNLKIVQQSGIVLILERSGLMVASSDSQDALVKTPDSTTADAERVFVTGSQNPIVRTAANQLLSQFQDLNTITEITQLWVKLEDQNYLISLEPIQDQWGLDWLSVVLIPEKSLFSPFYEYYSRLIWVYLLLLLLSTLGSFWISRRLTRSLNHIIHLIHTSLSQDLPPLSSLPSSRIQEKQNIFKTLEQFWQVLIEKQSDHQQKEQELVERIAQQTETLKLAQKIAHVGSWEFDLATHTLVWSEELYRIFGADPNYPVSRPDRHIQAIHPDDQELYAKTVLERLKENKSIDTELRIITQKGEIRYVRVRGEFFYNSLGKVVRLVGTVLDITDQKYLELTLTHSEQQMRNLANAFPARISYTDANQRYRFVNQASELWLDRPRSEIQGRTVAEILGPGDYAKVKPYIDRVFQGETVTYEMEMAYGGVKPRYVSGVLVPDCDPQGKVQGYYSLVTDISRLKQAEKALLDAKEEAESAAQLKIDFLARISHDIRTPMNGVLGLLTLLQRSELTTLQSTQVRLAQTSARSLLRVIDSVLDFSKVEAGKLDLESIPFNLYECFGDLAQTLAIQAEERGVVLSLDLHGVEMPWVRGDESRLKQIFNNLLSNALKFTKSGEVNLRVQVQACPRPDEDAAVPGASSVQPDGADRGLPDRSAPALPRLELKGWVQDTDIGIPLDRQSRIFEAFGQASSSTTRKYGGTGLGLAIVKHLCEMMGGSVSVTSEVGQGSCFCCTILLDSCSPEAVRKAQARIRPDSPLDLSALEVPAQASLKNRTFLIVDGYARRRSALCQQLETWGARTYTASSGQNALLLWQDHTVRHSKIDQPRARTDQSEVFRQSSLLLEEDEALPAHVDAVLIQNRLPDTAGLALLQTLQNTGEMESVTWILLTTLQDSPTTDAFASYSTLSLPISPPQLWHALSQIFSIGAMPPATPPPASTPAPLPPAALTEAPASEAVASEAAASTTITSETTATTAAIGPKPSELSATNPVAINPAATTARSSDVLSSDVLSSDASSSDAQAAPVAATNSVATNSAATNSVATNSAATNSAAIEVASDTRSSDTQSRDAGSIQSAPSEAGSTEVAASDAQSANPGSAEAEATEVGSTEAEATEVGSTEAKATEVGSTEVAASDAPSAEVGPGDQAIVPAAIGSNAIDPIDPTPAPTTPANTPGVSH
ncbi:MAG: ATP-binding protein [Prochlorothrix sp.]